MRNIQIALTKGRLEKHVIPLFEQIGIDCSELKNKGRKLVFQSKKYRYLIYFGESSRCCYLCRTWSSGYRGRWKRRFNGKRKKIFMKCWI